MRASADERTPLVEGVAHATRSVSLLAASAALTLGAVAGALMVLRGNLAAAPTVSTLAPGEYLLRGSFEGQEFASRNYCSLNKWNDNESGKYGISCESACASNETKPHKFTVTTNGVYRRLNVRKSNGDAYYCVTDADEELNRGSPAWKNLIIACDKKVNETQLHVDLTAEADFIIANVSLGAYYEYAVYSREQGKFCHNKNDKIECAYPGAVSRHSRFDFIPVTSPDVASCV